MTSIAELELLSCECSCDECRSYCVRRPCWGTPEDINRIIDAGYGKRLMYDWWVRDEDEGGDIPIISPAICGCEGERAPFFPSGICTFYTADGKCEIHSLKPLEGRVAKHDDNLGGKGVHHCVAMSWDNDEGAKVVDRWYHL